MQRFCNRALEDKNRVTSYKGKGKKGKYKYYRDNLLSVVGKVARRILIEDVRITDGMIVEEECGFRTWRGCIDQVFVLREVAEKTYERGHKVYIVFLNLEKAYYHIDREGF